MSDHLSAAALCATLHEGVAGVDDTYVVIPGRGGSWLRSFVPGLWPSCPRLVGIGTEEVVLVASRTNFTQVKRVLWRGSKELVSARSYLGSRVVRLAFGNHLIRRHVQIDGKENCRKAMKALGRIE